MLYHRVDGVCKPGRSAVIMNGMGNLCLRIFLILFLLLTGCVQRTLPVWFSKVHGRSTPLGPEEIFRLPEGDLISFAELLENLEGTIVIFVGESHDQGTQHQNQLRILQGLQERGREVAVAMEMFERSQQPILDRWSQGLLTEEAFLKDVDWENTWGFDYSLYKGILDEVKGRRLKLLGLNVSRDLVRKVAEKGISGLSPEDRQKLPEMDLSDPYHRAYINRIYTGHRGGSAKDFERFYEAQCLWDEGMAEALSDFLRSPEGKGKTVVVFAGNGHVVFDFGIPQRFYRRTPYPFKTVVQLEWEKDLLEEVFFTDAPRPLANFLWLTNPVPSEKKRPRIGIVFKPKDGTPGLVIDRVIPASPAEKAGLLPGDRLLSVEGKDIAEVKEIHEILSRKGWGSEITLTLDRQGSVKEMKVMLPPRMD